MSYVNLLAKFNISVETDPSGLIIQDMKKSSSANVMHCTASSLDGKIRKEFFVPLKTIKEGFALESNGAWTIQPGHNIWQTPDGVYMCTKAAGQQKLTIAQ